LGLHAFVPVGLVGVGLFEFLLSDGEDCALDEIRRAAGEFEITVKLSTARRHEILILDLDHPQTVSDQSVGTAGESPAKRRELHGFGLQRAV